MWNYRLIRDKHNILHIHEVFYTKKGKIWGYSESIDIYEKRKKDIFKDLKYIIKDLRKYPILKESKIIKNLVHPKWMNASEKELSKAMMMKEFQKKLGKRKR